MNRNDQFRFALWVIGLVLLFAIIAAAVLLNLTMPFDRGILMSLRDPTNISRTIGPPWLSETMRDFTSLGSISVLALFTATVAGYWLLTGRRRAAALLVAAMIGTLVMNDLLKLAFDRPRPDAILQSARVFSSGFPSGHAALSLAFYLSAARLAGSATRDARRFLLYLAGSIVLVIGFSRLYLGVHYPSDVLAGWCVGGVWVLAVARAMPAFADRAHPRRSSTGAKAGE
ncbi:MAG TPA: phosphatase PAP2 family protein [Micropepsaceae bacterium]|nr:phosphatase PAP2 family protein [Micropepsaceae bacterium]